MAHVPPELHCPRVSRSPAALFWLHCPATLQTGVNLRAPAPYRCPAAVRSGSVSRLPNILSELTTGGRGAVSAAAATVDAANQKSPRPDCPPPKCVAGIPANNV